MQERPPEIGTNLVDCLENDVLRSKVVVESKTCRDNLLAVGAPVPDWPTLQDGGRPDIESEGIREPGVFQHGWQQKVVKDVELDFKRQ